MWSRFADITVCVIVCVAGSMFKSYSDSADMFIISSDSDQEIK